jgi:hypothetical protein
MMRPDSPSSQQEMFMRPDCGREEWRDVPGFSGFYEVSSAGRVRSLPRMLRSRHGTRRHSGQVLGVVPDKDGYPRVTLRVDGQYYTRKVHRLVAEAFHGDKKNALHCEVDHIDGDRANATASNLRWVSRGENHHFRRISGRASKTHTSALTEQAVAEIRSTPIHYGTATSLAKKFGVPRAAVYDVLRGRTWRNP